MSEFVTDSFLEDTSSIPNSGFTDSNTDLSLQNHQIMTNTEVTGDSVDDQFTSEEEDDDDDDDAVIVEENDSQKQWDESMEQLNKVCLFVIFPLLGKFVGKKVANIIWKRIAAKIWG